MQQLTSDMHDPWGETDGSKNVVTNILMRILRRLIAIS